MTGRTIQGRSEYIINNFLWLYKCRLIHFSSCFLGPINEEMRNQNCVLMVRRKELKLIVKENSKKIVPLGTFMRTILTSIIQTLKTTVSIYCSVILYMKTNSIIIINICVLCLHLHQSKFYFMNETIIQNS